MRPGKIAVRIIYSALLRIAAPIFICSVVVANVAAETVSCDRKNLSDTTWQAYKAAAYAVQNDHRFEFLGALCDQGAIRFDLEVLETGSVNIAIPLGLITEDRPLFGLASFYNTINKVAFDTKAPFISTLGFTGPTLDGWKGRYEWILVGAKGANLELGEADFNVQATAGAQSSLWIFTTTSTAAEFIDLRYAHLWNWMRQLCVFFEGLLRAIYSITGLGWGLTIILLAVIVRVALLPLNMYTQHLQNRVTRIQSRIEGRLAEIKQEYDGEEAHRRLMDVYKREGVTPFFTLQPLIGIAVQLPLLIAIFNVLGESPVFAGASFLWIADLSVPDAIADIGISVPLFGNTLNVLPIIMTLVTVLSARMYRNPVATPTALRRQKTQLYLMSALFLVLFYPFPAGIVLYWAAVNFFQLCQKTVTDRFVD